MILTRNEEVNIRECIRALPQTDDIVVLDSLSTDATTDIARAEGARVIDRSFDNWAAHQNWAMANIDFKYPWVFYLDADERMSQSLWDEVTAIASNPDENRCAFYCGRKNYFQGRWIRHAMPPGMIMRFFKPPHIRFERLVNPTPVIDGPHGYLKGMFDHYNFSKGTAEWFIKHNNYSQLESIEALKSTELKLGAMFSRDPAVRRRELKRVSYRLPMRPLLRFLYMYVLMFGLFDGAQGLRYCLMVAMYEYWIDLKANEQRASGTAEPSTLTSETADSMMKAGHA